MQDRPAASQEAAAVPGNSHPVHHRSVELETMVQVDVLMLHAPGQTLHPAVLDALRNQGCGALNLHTVEGPRLPGESRVQAIARARNQARSVGSAKFAMFLDSDVALPPDGIRKLLYSLVTNPGYGALAINYQADAGISPAPHVAMGATLFYRSLLQRLRFRAEGEHCECYSCCADLRAMGYQIDYLPGLRALHLQR